MLGTRALEGIRLSAKLLTKCSKNATILESEVEVKVKEMKRLYEQAGYRFKRYGKGDHQIWHNAKGEVQVFDGKDSDDIDKGLERAMLRRLEPLKKPTQENVKKESEKEEGDA